MPSDIFEKKKPLLIIDDDTATAGYNKKIAEQSGYFSSIKTFESAEKAIDYLAEEVRRRRLFNGILIVDVYLDEMDGLEFLDEIDDRELVNQESEVLVLTAKNSARSREKTESSTLNTRFSIKPLTEKHLINLIESHV